MLKFLQLKDAYTILRFASSAVVPDWVMQGEFTSITRTADELSIVCPSRNVSEEHQSGPHWICLKLKGPFPFSQTGVLLSFIEPLSTNDIPIFAISTYETDYVFIPQDYADRAFHLLRQAGHELLAA